MKLKTGICKRSLHVAVFRDRNIIHDDKISTKCPHLPATVRNKLAMAHRCPYRNDKKDLDSVTGHDSDIGQEPEFVLKACVLGNSSSLFTSTSIVNSSRLLKSRQISYGSSIFDKAKLLQTRQPENQEQDLWISEEDIFVSADGTKLIHAATYGRYLNTIFGIGGWCLYPIEDVLIDELSEGFFITRKFGFVSHGQLLLETETEFLLNQQTAKYGVESIRSKAISVFAQKLGLGIDASEI